MKQSENLYHLRCVQFSATIDRDGKLALYELAVMLEDDGRQFEAVPAVQHHARLELRCWHNR